MKHQKTKQDETEEPKIEGKSDTRTTRVTRKWKGNLEIELANQPHYKMEIVGPPGLTRLSKLSSNLEVANGIGSVRLSVWPTCFLTHPPMPRTTRNVNGHFVGEFDLLY